VLGWPIAAAEPLYSDSTPKVDVDIDIAVIDGEAVTLETGPLVSRSQKAVVLYLDNSDDLVIKFQVSCHDGLHPLMREYFFLSLLGELQVTPRARFLSPAIKFNAPTPRTPKLAFRMNQEEYRHCGAPPRSALRYMLMTPVRATVNSLVRWEGASGREISFEFVIRTIDEAISALQLIHAAVRASTVVILEIGRVGFSELGHAIYVEEFPFTESFTDRRGAPVDSSATEWTLLGHRPSFRDDLARLLMVAAFMIHGLPWVVHCESLIDHPILMATYKMTGNWFVLRNGSDFLSGIPHESQRLIQQHLMSALSFRRAVAGIDDTPPFTEVQAELRAALAVATAPRPPSPSPTRSRCCPGSLIC
jgi:hypothetical protein